jgi:hypothetical protein
LLGANFENRGILELSGEASFTTGVVPPLQRVVNAVGATLTKTGAPGEVSAIEWGFTNDGVVEVVGGALQLPSLQNQGLIDVQGGILQLANPGGFGTYLASGGEIQYQTSQLSSGDWVIGNEGSLVTGSTVLDSIGVTASLEIIGNGDFTDQSGILGRTVAIIENNGRAIAP